MTRLQRGLALAALLAGVALVLPLAVLVRDQWDPLRRLDAGAIGAHGAPLHDAALVVTQLGAPLLVEVAAVVLAVLLRRRRRLSAYVLLSVFGAQLVSTAVKVGVDRVRPCVDAASCPGSASFPSGHSVAAAAFWGVVAVLLLPYAGRRAWWVLVVPVLVATSRVVLGVHYPSDVVAGLVVGGCWTAAWTAVFAAWKDERAGREVPLEEGVA